MLPPGLTMVRPHKQILRLVLVRAVEGRLCRHISFGHLNTGEVAVSVNSRPRSNFFELSPFELELLAAKFWLTAEAKANKLMVEVWISLEATLPLFFWMVGGLGWALIEETLLELTKIGFKLVSALRSLGPVRDLICSWLAVGGNSTIAALTLMGFLAIAGVLLALSWSETNRFSSSGSWDCLEPLPTLPTIWFRLVSLLFPLSPRSLEWCEELCDSDFFRMDFLRLPLACGWFEVFPSLLLAEPFVVLTYCCISNASLEAMLLRLPLPVRQINTNIILLSSTCAFHARMMIICSNQQGYFPREIVHDYAFPVGDTPRGIT